MKWLVRPSTLQGKDLEVPGDKSISHRALMLSAIAQGDSVIRNLAPGDDVASTAGCLRSLGARIESADGVTTVTGGELKAPGSLLDAGNSGTTMRLLSGLLAGQRFASVISGDESLRTRPMKRIAEPLQQMGARVSTDDGHAPLQIEGGDLHGIMYRMPVPSAQVKSCLLLAGLFASGNTSVQETVPTRDHTERMLRFAGVPVQSNDHTVTVAEGWRLSSMSLRVPGDFSSAAFLLAAAAVQGEVTVRNVGVNPSRTAFLRVLGRMGCRIEMSNTREEGGEPMADVSVAAAGLRGVDIGPDEAPELLDELPLVALLGALAAGETHVSGAAELRVKESDRIAAVAVELGKLGAQIEETPDGFILRNGSHGGTLRGSVCDSHGDHRIAMMLALAGTVATGETHVMGVECATISYPGFAETMASGGVRIEEA